jgi:hypothetical protein
MLAMSARQSSAAAAVATAVLLLFLPAHGRAGATRMDWPITEVKRDLARQFDCDWIEGPGFINCPLPIIGGVLDVYSGSDGLVETVELNPVIAIGPKRDARDEARSRTVATSIVRYFLPLWTEGPAWIAKAMRDVERPHTKRVTHVGPITVMVYWLQPALPDKYAVIFLTKRTSLEDLVKGLDW